MEINKCKDCKHSTKETVQKHGHWIYKKCDNAQCSCCGQYVRDVYDDDNEDRYCRHCGAKMDEKEEAKQK